MEELDPGSRERYSEDQYHHDYHEKYKHNTTKEAIDAYIPSHTEVQRKVQLVAAIKEIAESTYWEQKIAERTVVPPIIHQLRKIINNPNFTEKEKLDNIVFLAKSANKNPNFLVGNNPVHAKRLLNAINSCSQDNNMSVTSFKNMFRDQLQTTPQPKRRSGGR